MKSSQGRGARGARAGAAGSAEARALAQASDAYRQGHLAQAERLCRQVLEANPRHPGALHLLGTLAQRVGRADAAVDLLGRAAQLDPARLELHLHLGGVLAQLGRLDDAIAAYHRASTHHPRSAELWNALGAAYEAQGAQEAALGCYREAVRHAPREWSAHYNLGNALRALGREDDAVASYRQALALGPERLEVLYNLGRLCLHRGERREAIGLLRRARAVSPESEPVLASLGMALQDEGELEAAASVLREAHRLAPAAQVIGGRLGIALAGLGRAEEAAQAMLTPVRALRRVGAEAPAELDTFNRFSLAKLRHDIEQLRHLQAGGHLGAETDALVAEYEALLGCVSENGRRDLREVTELPLPRLRTHYNRLVYYDEAACVPGGALNPDLDAEAVAARFRAGEGFACVDELLRPQALARLQAFCRRATVWYQCHYEHELSASMLDGFSCPLLVQIAGEMRRVFASVIGERHLTTCWAYKYYGSASEVQVHADDGEVSVNFWITPDEANLDPAGGGLKIWNKRVPAHYIGRSTDYQLGVMRELLEQDDACCTRIPYRCNRAVVFESMLAHGTDECRFAEGYESRRINITMLFGAATAKR